ncbi:MAG TPA: hypothetical protein VMW38_21095, partial [Terriglobia bacterium]|nr:hypothetical protein [Terriglobia bacterium]
PVAEAEKLLLTTGARTGNTGMKWNKERTSLVETGTGPILVEPVTGTITLLDLNGAKQVDIFPLDGAGRRLEPGIRATKILNSWQLPIGRQVTPWYLITVLH